MKAYICSPYRGNVGRNKMYARRLCRWAIAQGYAPICPHLYLTDVLDDNKPAEREKGLALGLELLRGCDLLIVGIEYGNSEGMIAERAEAERLGIPIIEIYKTKSASERNKK